MVINSFRWSWFYIMVQSRQKYFPGRVASPLVVEWNSAQSHKNLDFQPTLLIWCFKLALSSQRTLTRVSPLVRLLPTVWDQCYAFSKHESKDTGWILKHGLCLDYKLLLAHLGCENASLLTLLENEPVVQRGYAAAQCFSWCASRYLGWGC